MTTFTSVQKAIDTLGEDRVLGYVNAKLRQLEYHKDRSKKDRAVLAAYKAGELTFGSTQVDMTEAK